MNTGDSTDRDTDAMAVPASPPVTALIAEDEAPQRRALREALVAEWPQLRIVAECEDGIAALEALAVHRPQVAFLDIRMPGVSGLDVARAAVAAGARVVFTTAYDDYAVRAIVRRRSCFGRDRPDRLPPNRGPGAMVRRAAPQQLTSIRD